MEMYDFVFKGDSIYQTVFFSTKTVLEYPTLESLKENDVDLFNQWKLISKMKHNYDIDEIGSDGTYIPGNTFYQMFAPYLPEFSKIVGISYGYVYIGENGEIKRSIKKISNKYEKYVINTFFDDLELMKENGKDVKLCGYNVFGNEIPLLIKRHIRHQLIENEKTKIPQILKKSLVMKPWDCDVIDIKNLWKFNGYETTSLSLIMEFLKVKKKVDLLLPPDFSKYYWDNIGANEDETTKFVELQCATQTNVYIQILNEIRKY